MLAGVPVDEVMGLMGNVTRMLAIFGGGVAAVTVCYAGIQFMTGAGDPQKMAQARMSLIGTVGGLILVGVAFLIPRVVSETVTEPSGGIPVRLEVSGHCDEHLRLQLVVQNWASTPELMNQVIERVQAVRDECHEEVWNPKVDLSPTGYGNTKCFSGDTFAKGANAVIGGQMIPGGLRDGGDIKGIARQISGRDAENNVLVYWDTGFRPTDGSSCWLYLSRLDNWSVRYPR